MHADCRTQLITSATANHTECFIGREEIIRLLWRGSVWPFFCAALLVLC
jgi:hypothetical protein